MAVKKNETVELNLDLGDLLLEVKKAAQKFGLSADEFVANAIERQIINCQPQEKNYTPHGGKHLYGKTTGYELTEDGRYYPAPTWADGFDDLFAEESAIRKMADTVIGQLNQQLIEVQKRIDKRKRALVDELGLDPEKDWIYYGGSRRYLQEIKPEVLDQQPE